MTDWATVGSGYSPDKFYTASRDRNKNKGSSRVIALPENILAEISQAIASRKYPDLRVQADFIRDAIYHRAYYLATEFKDKEIEKALIKDLTECSIAADRESIDKEEKAVRELIETLKGCDPVDVDGIIDTGRKYIDMMKWSRFKNQLKTELDRYRPEP